jgi:hypothetical protein
MDPFGGIARGREGEETGKIRRWVFKRTKSMSSRTLKPSKQFEGRKVAFFGTFTG